MRPLEADDLRELDADDLRPDDLRPLDDRDEAAFLAVAERRLLVALSRSSDSALTSFFDSDLSSSGGTRPIPCARRAVAWPAWRCPCRRTPSPARAASCRRRSRLSASSCSSRAASSTRRNSPASRTFEAAPVAILVARRSADLAAPFTCFAGLDGLGMLRTLPPSSFSRLRGSRREPWRSRAGARDVPGAWSGSPTAGRPPGGLDLALCPAGLGHVRCKRRVLLAVGRHRSPSVVVSDGDPLPRTGQTSRSLPPR